MVERSIRGVLRGSTGAGLAWAEQVLLVRVGGYAVWRVPPQDSGCAQKIADGWIQDHSRAQVTTLNGLALEWSSWSGFPKDLEMVRRPGSMSAQRAGLADGGVLADEPTAKSYSIRDMASAIF